MSRSMMVVAAAALAVGTACLRVPAVHAANSPTFRDCSLFVSGFDEDFVQTVFPHPTLSEMMHEAVLAADGVALHI